ncbi:NEDD4-binding protein 3-A-like [Xyrauchen texanus]|uniref:NEDD4-binding protein 3-A-like n=1 Tax=Xyrauchen texanus TaxID=154827 RepID=UPI0022428932|nr:NEDD4-binding protein 3-A-like [Xyrauchen texanus]XP_052005921.1 NEDD4-binding protein 3-A-like [Xyrauchen texanus]XP_052005922.1 NEDD4-binding protein 3-A-like [Xyrauchen texanus]
MATVQALSLAQNPGKSISAVYPASSLASGRCVMGSVGSLIEKPDVSPTKSNRAVPQVSGRQNHSLLKKGFNQRELLNYLNITKKEAKGSKHIIAGSSSIKREHRSEEEDVYSKVYHRDGREVDLGKNSLPIGGKFDKPRFRPSAFKPVTPKNFSSMQNIYPSKVDEERKSSLTNGMHQSYAKAAQKSLSTSSTSSSPSRPGTSACKGVLAAARGLSQEEENTSDSGHNSMNSLPPYRPPFCPHLGQISASMGHINHIGSLDRTSLGSKGAASTITEMSCQSMATLNRLQCYGSESQPPYELSHSLEDVVKDLEERLQEKEHELRQMRRNLDESEDAIAQVFEGKQRLWEKEVTELKHLYTSKLRQVSHQSQRSQRNVQLQLYKAQQERNRLQEELVAVRLECQTLKSQDPKAHSQNINPQLEETQWEVCQKSGEISLLKRQLRDSQAEVTQKLSEIFLLKTQLHEACNQIQAKDSQMDMLQMALQGARRKCPLPAFEDARVDSGDTGGASTTEERLRAELLLERRQNEAQTSAFEAERSTWQTEKEKVIRYQKEMQASYIEMYHKNEALERELAMLRGGRARLEGVGAGDEDVGGALQEEKPPTGLPWIERIESSEI